MTNSQEGKYFAFNFSSDYTDDTEVLALFRIAGGKLEETYNPCDHCNPLIMEIGEAQDELALESLKRAGVREVYSFRSTGSPADFLGTELIYDYPKGWIRYEGIFDGRNGENVVRFREKGIKLKLFTER